MILETDGAATHDQPLARADDARRQALLEAHGYTVLRTTWRQLVGQPATVMRSVGSALGRAEVRPPMKWRWSAK